MTCQEVDQLINENDWKHHKSTTESNWYYSIEYDNEDSPYVVSYSLDTKKKENQRIVTDITVNLYDNYDYDWQTIQKCIVFVGEMISTALEFDIIVSEKRKGI